MLWMPKMGLATVCSILFLLHVVLLLQLVHQSAAEIPPAIIVFGDSIVDAGNNNDVKTLLRCNFPPYGRDFPGALPTGRYSNGRIITDMIASYFKKKENVPAWLDPNLQDEDLLTGVTFASGGAGYDNLTSQISNVINLWTQLEMYHDYVDRLKSIVGEEKGEYIRTEAQYILVVGSNDWWNTYFFTGLRKKEYDIPSYVEYLVDAGEDYIRTVYGLGIKKLVVFGLPPLGCLPFVRTFFGGLERKCSEDFNYASTLFNSKMKEKVESLKVELAGFNLQFLGIYDPLLDLIENPEKYGLEVANYGCCGTGNIEVVILCNPLSLGTCPDDTKYVFWDAFHPTERAYEILFKELLGTIQI